MAENSKIEWTHHTANLWWGCTKVHKGCDNCYAEYFSDVRYKNNLWGKDALRKRIKSAFSNLDKWQKLASQAGEIHRVFVGSMMDIFEKPKPLLNPVDGFQTTGDLREELFGRIHEGRYPNLLFLLLTKRPSNINKMIPFTWLDNPPSNVMYGASVVDQKSANDVARHFKKVNGEKFLSVEPLLEPVDLKAFMTWYDGWLPTISWVIVGGESGHNKRPFNCNWARDIRDFCKNYANRFDIPFFFKQIDKIQPIPDDLMIREFPECIQKSALGLKK